LYSFHEMEPHLVDQVMARARRQLSPADYLRLDTLRKKAQVPRLFFELARAWENKGLYARHYSEKLAKRLWNHILERAGIKDPHGQVEKWTLRGGGRVVFRYVRNAVLDVGNLDRAVQLLRAYSASDGNPEVLEREASRLAVDALPIVG